MSQALLAGRQGESGVRDGRGRQGEGRADGLLYTIGNDGRSREAAFKNGYLSPGGGRVGSTSAHALNNSLWRSDGLGGGRVGSRGGSITIDVFGYVMVRDAWVCVCVVACEFVCWSHCLQPHSFTAVNMNFSPEQAIKGGGVAGGGDGWGGVLGPSVGV